MGSGDGKGRMMKGSFNFVCFNEAFLELASSFDTKNKSICRIFDLITPVY